MYTEETVEKLFFVFRFFTARRAVVGSVVEHGVFTFVALRWTVSGLGGFHDGLQVMGGGGGGGLRSVDGGGLVA